MLSHRELTTDCVQGHDCCVHFDGVHELGCGTRRDREQRRFQSVSDILIHRAVSFL